MTAYVDTNILARLMTNDLPELSAQAQRLVDSYGPDELIILDASLVELFFVLETRSKYGFSHALIAKLFWDIIVPSPQFRISNSALEALRLYADHPKLDFMDCLLAIHADGRAVNLLTFDKVLLKALR